jgi:hypothetical protein
LAQRTCCGAACNDDPLASNWLAIVLTIEVPTRSSSLPNGSARANPQNDAGERAVGRRANRQRAAAQVGHSHLAANRAQVLAKTVSRAAARDQRWSTFLKNHATAILACDFFVAVTATFGLLYVFIVIEHGTRRPAHVNVIRRPSANWTLQQLREAAFACDAQRVGDSLQRSASAWCIGAWCAGPSGKRCVDPEVRIPASIGGRCARAR